MEKKDYVSYDVAEILHQKKYNRDCYMVYSTVKSGTANLLMMTDRRFNNTSYILAPLLYEAQKWLREEFNIDVCPTVEKSFSCKKYDCCISKNGDFFLNQIFKTDNYEEALNEGIKEALKYI